MTLNVRWRDGHFVITSPDCLGMFIVYPDDADDAGALREAFLVKQVIERLDAGGGSETDG